MTLCQRYFAVCDVCRESFVFDSGERHACLTALHQMGWRHVVRDRGRELLCVSCVGKVTSAELAKITAKAGGTAPEVQLVQGRRRQGAFIDPSCGELVPFDQAYYEPFAKEHPLNLRCLTCCCKAAARRGYRVDIDRYLPREDHGVQAETQASLKL